MFLFFLFFIICPSKNEEILNFLNSLKSEEEIYSLIKFCPSIFLMKEGIARLKEQKYLEKIAKEGDWYLKYIVIEKLKNENILKEIYLKEEDQLIKDEAIKYIKDQDFLKNVILNDKNINALKNLKDENFLKELALKNENEEIKEKSLYFIENPSILKEILKISGDNNIIELAFLKLKNNPILKDILNEEFSEDKKIKALDYIDEGSLKEMLREFDIKYQKEALERVKDEKFLIDYFNKTEDLTLKISALKNIKDESFLKKVYKEENELKEYAILNIKDEEFLKENYKNLSKPLKENTLLKVRDQEFLKSIFLNESDEKLKEISLRRIFDKDFLKENYAKAKSKNLKKIILNNLTREEQEFFKKISLEENELSVKAEALTLIEDNDFIKDIILKENSIYLKLKGLERISNENVLKEIFEKENYWFIRYMALKKIKDKKFLENIKDKSFFEDIDKVKEIEGKIPREEICEDLNEKYFKDINTIKKIINDLGNNFSIYLKPSCKERRYFFEEENTYPPDRGRVFQVKLNIEIINRSSNFYKKIEYFGKNLSKRENFDKNKEKINNYYVKYYIPEIDFLDFTVEILKEFGKEEILKYLKSKNKYIKASALILKSYVEEK